MDIIKMARELGKAIQADQLYKDMLTANDLAENSAELQKKLNEFSELRTQINREIMKSEDEKSNDVITELDTKLRKLYDEIANSPEMIAYNAAKSALDSQINFVTQIISGAANGEDPDTIEKQTGCTGSCSSCGGCH